MKTQDSMAEELRERDEQLAQLAAELSDLRERCKPTSPPYLRCIWHADFDDTCPWCLRHRLAQLNDPTT